MEVGWGDVEVVEIEVVEVEVRDGWVVFTFP